MNLTWWLFAIAFFLMVGLFVALFNSLIRRKNAIAFAQGAIAAMLQKRLELIPNLVESVKSYVTYEKEVLENLTRLRQEAMKSSAESVHREVENAMNRLFAVAENYPQLKASETYIQMQHALTEVEDQLAAARRAYNAAVTDYNNGVEMFPWSLVASLNGMKRESWLQAPEGAQNPPDLGKLLP